MAARAIRLPPHSKEVEQSVLGALLIDKDSIIMIAPMLAPEHFYEDIHRAIYQSIRELYEDHEPIDLVTLANKLKSKRDLKKIGGEAYLTELAERVPTAANAASYAKIIRDAATKRELIRIASEAVEEAFDEAKTAAQVLDKSEQSIFSLSQKHLTKNFVPIKDALAESFDRLDELQKRAGGLRGVPTGFAKLDDALAGLQASNLIILAARPGLGKTALALQIAQNAAVKEKIPVGFFSLEMSSEELVDRLLVSQADIDAWRLKTGKLKEADFVKLSDAMGELAEAPLFIDDSPGSSILEMRTKARRLQAEQNVELIVVDYLQLAVSSRNYDNRVQEVTEISQSLKNLARELKVPVLALSQLSRAVEIRGSKEPQLADLRECLVGDTEIVNALTGEIWKIKDLALRKRPFPVYAMSKEGKLIRSRATEVFCSGEKMIYRLKMRSGREIRASANHPFYKLGKWARLDQLEAGDHVAVPRELPVSAQERPLELEKISQVRLLAHMIGDGCCLPRRVLQYTSVDQKCLQLIQKDAQQSFAVKTRCVAERSWYQVYFTSQEPVARGRRNPMVSWLDLLGLWGQRSGNKEIPAAVFLLPLEDIKLFLKHIWATDGSISIGKDNRVNIYYASSSWKLADQVRHLLLRCGVLTTIFANRKQNYRPVYQVHVSGGRMQRRFLKGIGGFGKKKDYAVQALDALEGKVVNPNVDIIPKEAWKIVDQVRQDFGISWRGFAKKLGMSYCGSTLFKAGIGRERMRRIGKFLDDPRIHALSESDIFWDEITSITSEKVEKVYDLKVEGVHNFVANDMFVHNSGALEQDADVVMFLYQPEEENRENISLKVAKHRNGPLTTMGLRFRGDRIKFYGTTKRGGE